MAFLYAEKARALALEPRAPPPDDLPERLFAAISRRYSCPALAAQKSEQFVLAVRGLATADERMRLFALFFGAADALPESPLLAAVFHFYLKALRAAAEPLPALLGPDPLAEPLPALLTKASE